MCLTGGIEANLQRTMSEAFWCTEVSEFSGLTGLKRPEPQERCLWHEHCKTYISYGYLRYTPVVHHSNIG